MAFSFFYLLLSSPSCYHPYFLPGSRAASLLRILEVLLVLANSATCAKAAVTTPPNPQPTSGARYPLLDRPSLQLGEVNGTDAVIVSGTPGNAWQHVDATSYHTPLPLWSADGHGGGQVEGTGHMYPVFGADRPNGRTLPLR